MSDQTNTSTVSVSQVHGRPMTVGQLKAFILAAERMGVSDDAVVKASVTLGGKLKSVEASS